MTDPRIQRLRSIHERMKTIGVGMLDPDEIVDAIGDILAGLPDDDEEMPDPDNIVFMTFQDEWAKLIRRMGAQLSCDEEEVVSVALKHLDTLLNLTIEAPIVIERRSDGQIHMGQILEKGQPEDPPARPEIEEAWTTAESGTNRWSDLKEHPGFEKLMEVNIASTTTWIPARECVFDDADLVRWRLRPDESEGL